MAGTVLRRQFITDAAGDPIGVILPLEEFALVEETLRQRLPAPGAADKLQQMEQAADDSLFMDDLRDTTIPFAQARARRRAGARPRRPRRPRRGVVHKGKIRILDCRVAHGRSQARSPGGR